eukprot:1208225-Amphidinium_carterae.1
MCHALFCFCYGSGTLGEQTLPTPECSQAGRRHAGCTTPDGQTSEEGLVGRPSRHRIAFHWLIDVFPNAEFQFPKGV